MENSTEPVVADEVNYDEMSDEDFEAEMAKNEAEIPVEQETNLEESETDPKAADATDTEDPSDDKDLDPAADPEAGKEEEAQENTEENSGVETKDGETKEDLDKDAKDIPTAVDYKEFYEKVTGEYKANGKVQPGVKDPDDIIAGLQMHANYHKRMEGFNQYRPIIRTLQTNGLDDPDKLNKFIALDKSLEAGDTQAIKQLLVDYNIDPIELDMEDIAFKPDNYMVTEQDARLYDTIDVVKDSPSYDRALDTVTVKWDPASRAALSENPRILEDLVSHMEDGTYDKVMEQVDYGRRFGKIPEGTSELEAYNMVLTRTPVPSPAPAQPAPVTPAAVTPAPTKDNTAAKKAAGIQNGKAPSKKATEKDYDPMTLSDADFEKYMERHE